MAVEKKEKGTLLTAQSKPYDVNGNTGTSHRVRVFVAGEIYSCKSSAAQVEQMKPLEGKQGEATLRFTSLKEAVNVELVSFAADK